MRVERPKILDLFRGAGRCSCCHEPRGNLHAAHIMARGHGGGLRLDISANLCALCVVCHAAHHDDHRPTKTDLLAIVARRYGMLVEDVEAVLRFFQRLKKETSTNLFHALAKDEMGAFTAAYDLAAVTWLEIKSEPEPKRKRCSIGGKKVRR